MKNFTIILILAFIPLIGITQEVIELESHKWITFEDTNDYKYILMDSMNVWHITKPNKDILFLTPDPSDEYAIISDKSKYYSDSINSFFQFKLFVNEGNDWDVYVVSFYNKYDFDNNKDGGIIESSYDNGQTWQNILLDNNIYLVDGTRLYYPNDSISSYNNQPGFTGLREDSNLQRIAFEPKEEIRGDTMLLRFTIVTDSVNNNNEGWMLDDFRFFKATENAIHSAIGDKFNLKIFPNPTNEILAIKSEDIVIDKIEILDLNAQILKTELLSNIINVADLSSGVYLIRINDKFVQRIVVQ